MIHEYVYYIHLMLLVVMDIIFLMLFLFMILSLLQVGFISLLLYQTFETDRFVICSFCPRLYDYHPESIPAPYNHSNIDSDEVLYYVDGDFMSRNHVEEGYISLHPAEFHMDHIQVQKGVLDKQKLMN